MRPSRCPKILRQRAIAVALLLSAVFAVAAITITVLGADPASADSASPTPAVTAVRGAVGYLEMLFGGGHWE